MEAFFCSNETGPRADVGGLHFPAARADFLIDGPSASLWKNVRDCVSFPS